MVVEILVVVVRVGIFKLEKIQKNENTEGVLNIIFKNLKSQKSPAFLQGFLFCA
jgi:hypothetical protein